MKHITNSTRFFLTLFICLLLAVIAVFPADATVQGAALVSQNAAVLANPGAWTPAGSLSTARGDHTATLLLNGQVLVAGGDGTSPDLTSAELYNPSTNSWTGTGSLFFGRDRHTATLLTNGNVLVAGGYANVAAAELYDPNTGLWTMTNPLLQGRFDHTSTRLANGQVLVVGGYFGTLGNGSLASAELYEPITGTWRLTDALNQARDNHTATLLPDGKVLVVGGRIPNEVGAPVFATSSAELYEPNTGTWTLTGTLNRARYDHTATLLANGKVLVAGGYDPVDPFGILASAELYDPVTGLWTTTGSLQTGPRYLHTATLLPNGQVLIAGGQTVCVTIHCSILPSAELYDQNTGTWSTTGSLAARRYLHTATSLSTGQVLVVGGADGNGFIFSAEIYEPAEVATDTPTHTSTPTDTPTLTPTNTPTETLTNTATFTPTHTSTDTPTNTATDTPTSSPTATWTFTPSPTQTYTPTFTFTPTATPTQTSTFTMTPTATACLSTTVLDDFNRANGGLGTNWSGSTNTKSYSIINNQVDVGTGEQIYWRNSSFGQNQEASVILTNIDVNSPEHDLLLKVQGESGDWSKGAIKIVYEAQNGKVYISTFIPQRNKWLNYASFVTRFQSGDGLAARISANGQVSIYHNCGLAGTVTLSLTDQQFFNSKGGFIGLWFSRAGSAIFDNFGGGTFQP